MRKITWAAVAAILLISITGCGGDCSIISAATTLGTTLRIGDLTACQWKTLYTDGPGIAQAFGIDELSTVTLPALTDAQAQAIVDFLDANSITTVDDLTVLVNSGELTVEDLPESLQNFYNEFQSANP